jgi:hypothetical protein
MILLILLRIIPIMGARDDVVGWGVMLQDGSSRVRVPIRFFFLSLLNHSSRTMAIRFAQPLIETIIGRYFWE